MHAVLAHLCTEYSLKEVAASKKSAFQESLLLNYSSKMLKSMDTFSPLFCKTASLTYSFTNLQGTESCIHHQSKAVAQNSTFLKLPTLSPSATCNPVFSITSLSTLWRKTKRALPSSSSRKPPASLDQVSEVEESSCAI